MKIFLVIILSFASSSCSDIEFVYNENKNLVNPLYGKTKVDVSGLDVPFLKSYVSMFFGDNTKPEYQLVINIEEEKVNRSIETNQAASNVKYELRFFYILRYSEEDCDVYKKEVVSNFSITPKSSGYNYGTDASLERNYELAVAQNLNNFVTFLSSVSLNDCL